MIVKCGKTHPCSGSLMMADSDHRHKCVLCVLHTSIKCVTEDYVINVEGPMFFFLLFMHQ